MPRRGYEDDGFPDIRDKPGTPSEGVGYYDDDDESGEYSRPETSGSGDSATASLTFEDWQKKSGIGAFGDNPDEFSKTDGPGGTARDVEFPAAFKGPGGDIEGQKSKLKAMIKKGKSGSMYEAAKSAKAAHKAAHLTTAKNPEATKRAKAREKVMKQRQDHEAWVEQLAAVCDATNVEKERLAAEIIFLEHNMDRKKLLRVILRLGRIKLFTGYQTWVNNTIKPDRLKKFAERDRIRAEIEAYYAQIKADEVANEVRQQKMLEARLAGTSESQYQLILKIFSKMTGDKTRESLAHWRGLVVEFNKKYTLMKRILSKLVGAQIMKGWTKWYYIVFVAGKMSLDETIKALQYELAIARKRKNEAEAQVEAIAENAMKAMLANASSGQKALLNRILTKFCTLYIRYGMKVWKEKVNLYKTAKSRMTMVIQRLCNSQLNYGFRRWINVAVKDKSAIAQMAVEKYQRETGALKERCDMVATRIKALMVKVEQMRESVQLQAIAADRVAHGLPDLADEFANIAYVDRSASENPGNLVKLIPPAVAAAAETGASGAMGQTTIMYGANKTSASAGSYGKGGFGRGMPSGGDNASLASSLDSPSMGFGGIGFGTPMAPEDRANLLVFIKSLEGRSADPKLARVAPALGKHKKVIKKLALVGDPRLSACIKAYERTGDPDDLVESIEMIAAGMDFNVSPMY